MHDYWHAVQATAELTGIHCLCTGIKRQCSAVWAEGGSVGVDRSHAGSAQVELEGAAHHGCKEL